MKRQRMWSLRTVLAAVLAISALGVFAAFGGAGVDSATAQYEYEYGQKVTICHVTGSEKNPNVTIRVSVNAMTAHLAHGDTLGPCR